MTWHEIRLSGLGGQGIILMGRVIGEAAALHEKKEAIMTEAYGPEITGGWSRADIVISDEPVDYPLVESPDILVAMGQDALDRDASSVKQGGLFLVNEGMVNPSNLSNRRVVSVPATAVADQLGRRRVANIVMLGAFAAVSGLVSEEALRRAVTKYVPKGTEELNQKAFERGLTIRTIVSSDSP